MNRHINSIFAGVPVGCKIDVHLPLPVSIPSHSYYQLSAGIETKKRNKWKKRNEKKE